MGVKDKNGDEVAVGDEIVVRGKVAAIPMDLQDESGNAILQVQWQEEEVPLLDYVQSKRVEKALSSQKGE